MSKDLSELVQRPLHRRDQPTDTHYTFEVLVYWQNDLLDAVRAGVRRKLWLGGLRTAGHSNIAVELPEVLRRYEFARLFAQGATLRLPKNAEVILKRDDRVFEPDIESFRRPFEGYSCTIYMGDTLAVGLEDLRFLCRFVHKDGAPRYWGDWVPSFFFPGKL